MDISTLLFILIAAAAAGFGGYFFAGKKSSSATATAEAAAAKLLTDAEHRARHIMTEAQHQVKASEQNLAHTEERAQKIITDTKAEAAETRKLAEKILTEARTESAHITKKLEATEERLTQKENHLDQKVEALEQKKAELERRTGELAEMKVEAEKYRDAQKSKLEEVAHLTRDEAKQRLIDEIEQDSEQDLISRMRKIEDTAKDEADKKAHQIISGAIQRMAGEVTHANTITMVQLANDEMKGKIIGREGRNITAFEMATGVDVIVDDSPGAVLISGFDLVRRDVAKRALEQLVKDGRIQPARIEEEVAKAQKEVEMVMRDMGDKAAAEVGSLPLPPEVTKILGRLHYRTSYGQNNLRHAIEVANIGQLLASELGVDTKLAKTACLLHDIGKAVDHEIEGPHAVIGANILRKFKVDPRIIHAVEAHHGDIPTETILDAIVQSADAISGARPGARRESLENYIQRLQELENIATGFEGVKKAYAIAAGREVRVFVDPAQITDLQSIKLGKGIARKIEEDMNYPGQIKVLVIRESRVIEYAK